MLMQINRRLRDRAVVTAAILSLVGCGAAGAADADRMGGSHDQDGRTASPIKHLIVIMGENRTFDHVFATYQPRQGEHVENLLSKGIINKDGSPGPNYGKAAQFAAIDTNFYSIHPDHKTPYNNSSNKPPKKPRNKKKSNSPARPPLSPRTNPTKRTPTKVRRLMPRAK